MDKEIIFIGGIFPNELLEEYTNTSRGPMQFAADSLQKSILRGLVTLGKNVSIISVPFLGNYPANYSEPFVKEAKFSYNKKDDGKVLKFTTIKLLEIFSKYFSLKKEVKKIIRGKNDNTLVVIFYGLFPYFLKTASQIKTINPNIPICLIIPDLPEMMGGDDSKLKIRIYNFLNSRVTKNNIDNVDGFVVLSKYMLDYLGIADRRFRVIEGIYSKEEDIIDEKKESNPTVFYSGTLAKRYGILNLLNAFDKIENQDFRLWICGDGDCREDVENFAKKDKRIRYFGQLERKKVLIFQKRATMLVNPRTSVGEYTKYSFPSKTIEYLASGTPTIIYRLAGIPEEYYTYCLVCEEETAKGLKEMIIEVASLSQDERNSIGEKAKSFIINNKNENIQARKIVSLIESFEK